MIAMSGYQTIPSILKQVKKLNPISILDVGIGFGQYGFLFRDLLEFPYGRYTKESWQVRIDGVEAFKSYHNPVYDFTYDNVYLDDILLKIDSLPCYDCITLIDVLESFSKEDGLRLIEKLIAHSTKGVLVSTPFYADDRIRNPENSYEHFRKIWSMVDFEYFNFTYERVGTEQNGAHLFMFKKNSAYKKMPFEQLVCSPAALRKPLRIAYYLPHKNLTGGMKMLLQQMKYLRQRGHELIACMKDAHGSKSALPEWFALDVDKEVIVPAEKSILAHLPPCDVIVAGWITQLIELKDSKIPVLYWEQGSEWLFGDIKEQKHLESISIILEHCYLTKHALVSVSPYVSHQILARYGRKTPMLSNGIDTTFYCVGEKSNTNKIVLIGNPCLPFKGFDCAFKALSLAWKAGYRFHVDWVCQTRVPIPEMPFSIYPIIQPAQEELVQCYQRAELLLFTSWYEGFGMPPLEAMSCGTAVVCTECGGTHAFVKNEYNALTSAPGDITSLAINIAALLKIPQLRTLLSTNGRKTAEERDYTKIIIELEKCLYLITSESDIESQGN